MDSNIVDILVILMREFPSGDLSPEEFEPVTKDLMARGFSEREIETAFFWFHNRQEIRNLTPPMDEVDPRSFRVLHEIERMVLSIEGWGYLLGLRSLELISLSELNAIIDKAMLFGGRTLDLEEVKLLATSQIMEQEGGLPMFGHSFFVKTTTEIIQ